MLFTLPILATLVFGSLGVSNAFAEDAIFGLTSENVSAANADTFLEVASVSPDIQIELLFDGSINGWAIIGGQAYANKMGQEGYAVYQGNGVRNVKSDAKISIADQNATLELKSKLLMEN